MNIHKTTPQELWARQQINSHDVDYRQWNKKRESIRKMSRMTHSCIFTVDVFKERYDFASDNFACLFGYNPVWLQSIRKQGELLEERIHPDDRQQLFEFQVEHGEFIYSLPTNCRNDYSQIFQFRMRNAKQQYIQVISRHQVIEKDRNGKAWIIMGVMDIAPDQLYTGNVKRTVINRKNGDVISSRVYSGEKITLQKVFLTKREKEILLLIRQGFLSKEIAHTLNLSIYTVNNHRKNILAKLNVDHSIEAINLANDMGILDK